MERRALLRGAVAGVGSVAFSGSLWRGAAAAEPGPSRYGPLQAADANGVRLPAGFTSRVVARSGRPVGATSYVWHPAPDGGACFPAAGGGWTYVSNSEVVPGGGASAIRFGADGVVRSAYRILSGTRANCAGGATPWGRWLSCEEVDRGAVFETDPTGTAAAVRRPSLGLFKHEAAAVDPELRVVYLTEDEPDGCFYRFRPRSWPDLSTGSLQVMVVDTSTGVTSWRPVPDPSAATTRTRHQVAGVARFDGGEGAWYAAGSVWFTTKGDNRVWRHDARAQRLDVVYDDTAPGTPLRGVDNVVGSSTGELFVAEDGGDMQICTITAAGRVAPFLQLVGHAGSEITGPALDPSGRRLCFSSQRGTTGTASGGMTFEVAGPFRRSTSLPGPWKR